MPPTSVSLQNVFIELKGARLTAVTFVLDYLILGFDERGALTSLVWPEICRNNIYYRYGDSIYRNVICDLIGNKISAFNINNDELIEIEFDDATISIDLGALQSGKERAILMRNHQVVWVWN